jgi:hypothetical protein
MNPILGIMEISKKISSKYCDQINKGDIELDKILESIMSKIPGMGPMISSLMKKPTVQTNQKIIMDDNFSTADVELGKMEESDSQSNMKFGNMLKIADQFGVIPGGKDDNKQNPISNLLNGFPNDKNLGDTDSLFSDMFKNMNANNGDTTNLLSSLLGDVTKGLGQDSGKNIAPGLDQIGKMMNIIKKLESSKSKNDVNNIKHEMDTFLQKDLGIDINKLNDDMKKLI